MAKPGKLSKKAAAESDKKFARAANRAADREMRTGTNVFAMRKGKKVAIKAKVSTSGGC